MRMRAPRLARPVTGQALPTPAPDRHPLLWPLMAMHALTFAVGHLGAMAFIARAVPQRFGAAAQGAAAAMAAGLILSLGTMAAAALYPTFGGRTYGIGVAMSAIGVPAAAWS